MSERNRLTNAQRFSLTKYLEANQGDLIRSKTSPMDAAGMATAALGFTVTPKNIITIMGNGQEAVIKHVWPRGSSLPANGETPHMPRRMAVLVRVLDQVVRHLGSNGQGYNAIGTPSLETMFRELVAEADVPLPGETA